MSDKIKEVNFPIQETVVTPEQRTRVRWDEINKTGSSLSNFPDRKIGTIEDYTEFEDDGTIHMVGDATVWNDIDFPGLSLAANANAPGLASLFGSGNILGRAFDGAATTEQLYGGGEILHNYKEGTDISFHVHWAPTTADSGSVKWQLEYSWQNVDGTFSAPTTISIISAAGGTAWKHKKTSFADISGTGMEIGSHFVFRFFRDPTDGFDTYDHDAALISLGIHYQQDTLGSRQMLIK